MKKIKNFFKLILLTSHIVNVEMPNEKKTKMQQKEIVNSQKIKKLLMVIKNQNLVTVDKKIILPYSDKKIIANPPLLYSVLNPDTNSDSPSAKSKGARLVSAIIVLNQKTKKKQVSIKKNCILYFFYLKNKTNLKINNRQLRRKLN